MGAVACWTIFCSEAADRPCDQAGHPPKRSLPFPLPRLLPSQCTAGTRPAWWRRCSAAACRIVGGHKGRIKPCLQMLGPLPLGPLPSPGQQKTARYTNPATDQGTSCCPVAPLSHLSTGQHGLEQVAGIHGSVALARTHNVVDLCGTGRVASLVSNLTRLGFFLCDAASASCSAPHRARHAGAGRLQNTAVHGATAEHSIRRRAPSMKSTIWPWLSCTSLITAFSRSSNSPRYLAHTEESKAKGNRFEHAACTIQAPCSLLQPLRCTEVTSRPQHGQVGKTLQAASATHLAPAIREPMSSAISERPCTRWAWEAVGR